MFDTANGCEESIIVLLESVSRTQGQASIIKQNNMQARQATLPLMEEQPCITYCSAHLTARNVSY